MALSALQYAIDHGASQRQGSVIKYFDQLSPLWKRAPTKRSTNIFYDYERWTTLPGIGWRGINGSYTESTGVTNPEREYLKFLGGEAEVDLGFMRINPATGRESLKRQMMMKIQSAANEYDRAALEGSELSNPDEMVGFRSRISGSQLINAGTGGATLTLAMLDQLIDSVPFVQQQFSTNRRGEGITCALLMNRTLRRKINALIDAATGSRRITEDRDTWGNQVQRYGGCEIWVMEQMGDGSTMLDFDEDDGDASPTADTASIYCVAFGEGLVQMLYGGQPGDDMLFVDEFDAMEQRPRRMRRFEGYFGQVIEHPRAIARLYHINNA